MAPRATCVLLEIIVLLKVLLQFLVQLVPTQTAVAEARVTLALLPTIAPSLVFRSPCRVLQASTALSPPAYQWDVQQALTLPSPGSPTHRSVLLAASGIIAAARARLTSLDLVKRVFIAFLERQCRILFLSAGTLAAPVITA